MRTAFSVLAATLTIVCAQEKVVPGTELVPEVIPPAIPARRIVPSEVVQESIRLVRFTNKQLGVMWTYTEVGATNMLAFRDAHEGQTVRTVIGAWQSRPYVHSRALPPGITNHAQWREGWLKRRTDKIVGVSKEDAEKIMAGLKSQ